ncbi:MetQ/NlpA family ABC transporter substrate-binding protein [Lacticaseibacillus thailandensis]|nr:MetQ/NlpA family ABC transporter substrate-binding protein [Lacticaseibacillus thailandensis]
MKKKFVALTALVAALPVFLAACGSSSSSTKTTTVKLGVIGSDADVWKPVAKRLKKQHINLKLVEFTDYNKPNQALQDGDIDLNAFQTVQFLNNWNKAHKTNIVSVGKTYIGPVRLYSQKVKKLSQLKKGAKVAIANDQTNEARALELLQQAGLIKLKGNVTFPTVRDITSNKLGLKITPVDAAQTARSLTSVDAAVVNNDIALNAKLKPSSAIYVEKITKASKPFVNVVASTKKNRNNKVYKKVVKAYQTQATKKVIKKVYNGSTEAAWDLSFK